MTDASWSIYLTALAIGGAHGLEPGHGWPVAAIFALNKRNRWTYGAAAGLILAFAHLVSSFAVVAVYAVADRFWQIGEFTWLHYVTGGLLIVMGLWQLRRGGHHHHAHGNPESSAQRFGTLWALAGFAFLLGFAHEEEIAIIALSAGKLSAWAVMAVYAGAVSVALVILTLVSIATFNRLEHRIDHIAARLPMVSALVLILMGVLYVLDWL